MKKKYIDKQYIYEREDKKCYFCGKNLYKNKVTLDHYYPRSLGGTEEVFNLVSSCKKCNNRKKSSKPEDYLEHWILYFIKGIHGGRIVPPNGMSHKSLIEVISECKINHVYKSGDFTIFECSNKRFYVSENKINRIIDIKSFADED